MQQFLANSLHCSYPETYRKYLMTLNLAKNNLQNQATSVKINSMICKKFDIVLVMSKLLSDNREQK